MLYICIPAFNEAPTVGLLLWRIRKVFEEYPREYEILVLDDGSTDATAETLTPYTEVLPLSILKNERQEGYAPALDKLARAVSARTRYPRRDAMIVMQGDFTDQPEHLPELSKRFEGGADLVVAERGATHRDAPLPVRRLRRVAPWLLRPFVKVPASADAFRSFRLYRIALVRDVLKEVGDAPLTRWRGWAANVELLVKAARFSRRIETAVLEPRYDLRPRPSRVRAFAEAVDLYRFGWANRARRIPTTMT